MNKQSVRLTIRLNLEHPLFKGFGRLYDDLPEDAQGKKVGVQKLIEQAIAHTYGDLNKQVVHSTSERVRERAEPKLVEASEEVLELGKMEF